MITKDLTTLKSEFLEDFSIRLPNMDLSEGTPERELFIESPIAGHVTRLYEDLTYTSKLFSPFNYYEDLEEEDINKYCANFNVVPLSATYSSGQVTFYATTEPSSDIIIQQDSTIVSTAAATPIQFRVTTTYTMYQSIIASYYNSTTNRWEITCNVEASLAGPDYRAGSETVTNIDTPISGIDGVVNENAITGGEVTETIAERLQRVSAKFQGRGLASTIGVENFVLGYVATAVVVGASDADMVRDEGFGGALDIYVIGSDYVSYTETVVVTSTGLDAPELVDYTADTIICYKQPVNEIVSVLVNDVVLPSTYYSLEKDTGILAKSTRSSDAIVLTSTGLLSNGYFEDSDSVVITYTYNYLLEEITADLTSPTNYYDNRDYLLREMTEVLVDVDMEVTPSSGYVFLDILSTIELAIDDVISAIKDGGTLQVADLITTVGRLSQVDNVNLTTILITPIGGGTKTAQGDIIFAKKEYPATGTLTIEEWTS